MRRPSSNSTTVFVIRYGAPSFMSMPNFAPSGKAVGVARDGGLDGAGAVDHRMHGRVGDDVEQQLGVGRDHDDSETR